MLLQSLSAIKNFHNFKEICKLYKIYDYIIVSDIFLETKIVSD